jgi:hypothetical protein
VLTPMPRVREQSTKFILKEFMMAKSTKKIHPGRQSCACKTQGREVGFTLPERVQNF